MSTAAKILVAEDDIDGAFHLKQSLNRLGYQVAGVAHAGEDVMGIIASEQPDLILMDVTLSGSIDGIQAAEQVRNRYDIPIIYLTAHSGPDIFQRAKITAPHAYLVKPFELTNLQHAIELALQLRESENRYRTIFEISDSAMMIIDSEGTVTMVNAEFEHLTGHSKAEVEHRKNWADLFPEEEHERVRDIQHQAQYLSEVAKRRFELSLMDKSGTKRIVNTHIRLVPESDTAIVSMDDITDLKRAEQEISQLNTELSRINADLVQEIAERKKIEKQLRHQADHDPLTGLPNRVLLFDRLKQAFAFDERHNSLLALMLLDLDNFKTINDTMGHLSGDILLKKVAKRLQQCMRQYDTVGRIGGDEFVIVANDIQNVHDIIKFADKIRGLFELPFDILGQPVHVTTSIGVAIYPIHGTSVKMLMTKADTAMYAAKNSGKNAYCFFANSMEIKESDPVRARRRTAQSKDVNPGPPHHDTPEKTTLTH